MNISGKSLAIGNDIVDLKDPDSIGVLQNRKFLDRVFTPAELNQIQTTKNTNSATSSEALKIVWTLWAAKESAFKALAQLDNEVSFSPIRFECNLKESLVTYNQKVCHTLCVSEPEYVACVSLAPPPNKKDIKQLFLSTRFSQLKMLPEYERFLSKVNSYSRESNMCHAYALWLLENEFGYENGELRKEIASPRVAPRFYCNNKEVKEISLSLSHQGRFCSVAILQNP